MLSSASGSQKLGQPEPDSNFASELNSGFPQHTHTYFPLSWLSTYSPVKGASVPFLRAILYCSGVSCCFHSASDFSIFLLMTSSSSLTAAFSSEQATKHSADLAIPRLLLRP